MEEESNGTKPLSTYESRPVYTWMEVFTGPKYRNLQFQKALTPEEAKALRQIKSVQTFFTENCVLKAAAMGAGGSLLGLLFGIFFFSMKPVDINTELPFKQQIRQAYSGFGTDVGRTMKGFAKIGFLYSLFDCAIAKHRARQDLRTALYAGCATGASLAWKGGVGTMATGCIGFATFSGVMELWNPLGSATSRQL